MDKNINYLQVPFLLLSDNPQREYHKQQFEEVYRGFDGNESLLGRIFFSEENIDILQKQIILTVFKKSNVKIPIQSPERLLIVMRYVFNVNAKHLPTDYKEQIRELNDILVDTVVPDIITNVELNEEYMKKVNGERVILERPIHINNKKVTRSYDSFIENYP